MKRVVIPMVLVLAGLFYANSGEAQAPQRFNPYEASILEIQSALSQGRLTSRELVDFYMRRIDAYDRQGVRLNTVRNVYPLSRFMARVYDELRGYGFARGPLYGIPVMLKDNVATYDQPTTAGSVALEGSYPPQDSFVARRLRAAGAILMTKGNLTEFANYLATGMPAGYSSLGGYVFNPYDPTPLANSDGRPNLSPGGSSSGPAAAVAANLVTVSVGTETSGSILSPGTQNAVVGIKPTVGLISRAGIIPIASAQDIAGPFGRTVEDAAILLGAMTGVDPDDPATRDSVGKSFTDYTQFLDRSGLRGARIGVPRQGFLANLNAEQQALIVAALNVMRGLGAVIIDPVTIPTQQQLAAFPGCSPTNEPNCSSVLKFEFKRDLNAYLRTLWPTSPIKTLRDVVEFNERNSARALKYGQALAIASEGVNLTGPDKEKYELDRQTDIQLARIDGLDAVYNGLALDALIFGGNNGAGIAARAGYPSIVVPAGFLSTGAPYGVTFSGKAWSEPTLIKLAYAYEQATKLRRPPAATPPLP